MNAVVSSTSPMSFLGAGLWDFINDLNRNFPRTELFVGYDSRYEANQPQTDLSSPGPLRIILDTLKRYQSAEWKNRRRFAQLPVEQAFVDAATFAKASRLNVAPMPDIYLAADGEVNFLWKSSNVHIDLGFYGNGKLSYYAEGNGCSPMYGDDLDVSAGMPAKLLGLFRA
jgi:hypothetical protein